MVLRRAVAFVAVLLTAPAAAETWPVELWDPAAEGAAGPADLVLPMPCDGAMAFQRVMVPVEADDPLADRRLRLGQSQQDTGYADYLRPEYLRGGFVTDDGASAYYIARYELTVGQYQALTATECPPEPSRRDRVAKGGLSWFDAVDLGRRYAEWLFANASEALPRQDGQAAFPRLPTEAEWEYAVRGGARIDPTDFPARRFFTDGELADFAFFQGAGSGRLMPVGLRRPNPLGLFDVYGNAEELMLEPFRINAVGRRHGQVGGIVTRGGSVLLTDAQIYSAQRVEYPPFIDGTALAGQTFGLRLVLGLSAAYSDARVTILRDRWIEAATAEAAGSDADPLTELAAIIDEEVDPRRKGALTDLELEFRLTRDAAQEAIEQTAKSTLLSGAVFVAALSDGDANIGRRRNSVVILRDQMGVALASQRPALEGAMQAHLRALTDLRAVQKTYLLSLRSALDTLTADVAPERVERAQGVLREELEQSGQTSLLPDLERFSRALAIYRQTPDMDQDALMALALSRDGP